MKSLSVTIQMKSTEQYFPVVLFIFRILQTANLTIFFSVLTVHFGALLQAWNAGLS